MPGTKGQDTNFQGQSHIPHVDRVPNDADNRPAALVDFNNDGPSGVVFDTSTQRLQDIGAGGQQQIIMANREGDFLARPGHGTTQLNVTHDKEFEDWANAAGHGHAELPAADVDDPGHSTLMPPFVADPDGSPMVIMPDPGLLDIHPHEPALDSMELDFLD